MTRDEPCPSGLCGIKMKGGIFSEGLNDTLIIRYRERQIKFRVR